MRPPGPGAPSAPSPKKRDGAANAPRQLLFLAFNFVATVAVTFINKLCFSRVQFGFPAMLCNVHYVVTWLGVEAMRRGGMFVPLAAAPSPREPFFAAIVLVVGTVTPLNNTRRGSARDDARAPETPNRGWSDASRRRRRAEKAPSLRARTPCCSLKLNSVGFYQLFKILVTPAVVATEYALDRAVPSRARAACLAGVCACAFVSSRADLEFNLYGTACATLWLPLAALYKVHWGRCCKRLGCSTPALMHAVYP